MSKVFIVSAKRSATGSFLGTLKNMSAGDLGAEVLKSILLETQIDPNEIDEVTRVGRSPLRKLSKGDRFIEPMLECEELGLSYDGLIESVVNALKFDCVEDEESVKLQTMIKDIGLENTLIDVTGLEKGHPILQKIIKLA